MYVLKFRDKTLYLLLYVDNVLMFGDMEEIVKVKNSLMCKFKMKDLAHGKKFLGLNIDYDMEKRRLSIDEADLIKKLADRFRMKDVKNVKTPMKRGFTYVRNSIKDKVCELPHKQKDIPMPTSRGEVIIFVQTSK